MFHRIPGYVGRGVKTGAGGGAAAASQATMEAALSVTEFSSPGRQHFHPSAAKAWVRFNSAAGVAASYNITSITDSGVGDWSVNIATDFSSASYCGVLSVGGSDVNKGFMQGIDAASAAGVFNIGRWNLLDTDGTITGLTPTRTDPPIDEIHASFFGDRA